MRSNTLFLERFNGWSGLLIEADPINFTKMLQKNRRAYLSPTCLSITKSPSVVRNNNRWFNGVFETARNHRVLISFRFGPLDRHYANLEKSNEPLEITGILSHGQKRGSFARAREHDGECAWKHTRCSLHGRACPRAVPPIDTLHRRVGSQNDRLFQPRHWRQRDRRIRNDTI